MSLYLREIPPIEGEDARRLMEKIQKNNEKNQKKLMAIKEKMNANSNTESSISTHQ
ncbi:hypothetical protein [Paenibacillus wenxiniae]|uniref:Uncharacterized protein n=1 Tax=Paenibacillus wenxiniae TaxID=1636843 RepID=A0ABW4RF96_9BACL